MLDSETIGERFAILRKTKKDTHGKDMPIQQLAKELANEGYIKDYDFDVIRQEIGKVESKGKFPQLFLIEGYSKYFNVTADYLLGLRDTKLIDENIAMINRITGLSDDSINTLKKVKGLWNKKEKNTLNYIMKNTDLFLDFLKWLSIYIDNEYIIPLAYDKEKGQFPCNNPLNSVVLGKKVKDNKGNEGFKSIGISIDILESHAMLKMQEIINTWKNLK